MVVPVVGIKGLGALPVVAPKRLVAFMTKLPSLKVGSANNWSGVLWWIRSTVSSRDQTYGLSEPFTTQSRTAGV